MGGGSGYFSSDEDFYRKPSPQPDTTVPTPKPAEPAPQPDLTSLDSASIRKHFTMLADKQRNALSVYQPAFDALRDLVKTMQISGLPFVGLELAGVDKFRDMKINNAGLDQPYCTMTVSDLILMVRINDDTSVDIHSYNLNKAQAKQEMSELWVKSKNEKEAPFHHYDLTQDADKIALIEATLQIAALCSTYNELHKNDITPQNQGNISKLRLAPKA